LNQHVGHVHPQQKNSPDSNDLKDNIAHHGGHDHDGDHDNDHDHDSTRRAEGDVNEEAVDVDHHPEMDHDADHQGIKQELNGTVTSCDKVERHICRFKIT
jgi:hypothetical protein